MLDAMICSMSDLYLNPTRLIDFYLNKVCQSFSQIFPHATRYKFYPINFLCSLSAPERINVARHRTSHGFYNFNFDFQPCLSFPLSRQNFHVFFLVEVNLTNTQLDLSSDAVNPINIFNVKTSL